MTDGVVVCSISLTHVHPGFPVLSGKVHGSQRVLVDLYGLGQGLLVTTITLARSVASFSTVIANNCRKLHKNPHYLTFF